MIVSKTYKITKGGDKRKNHPHNFKRNPDLSIYTYVLRDCRVCGRDLDHPLHIMKWWTKVKKAIFDG